jgi:DNA replication protein DnaC
MLGNRGTGKTHLSAGIVEHYRRGLMITQATLLYRLRESYGKNNSVNVIDLCQKAAVLVIDDIGLSAGGKDELPMLHEILSFRHSQFKPTVLTGNIKPSELPAVIGERMVDRLQQSLFCEPLIFAGTSNRPARRSAYETGN